MAWVLPPRWSWGVGFWALQPLSLVLPLWLAAAVATLPPVLDRLARVLDGGGAEGSCLDSPIIGVVVALTCAVGFYLLRVATLLYGDGATILGIVTDSEADLFTDQLKLQPLSMLLHVHGIRLLSGLGLTNQSAFAMISAIGGSIGILAVWQTARVLRLPRLAPLAAVAAAMSSGAVILFFGHIENYTWAVAVSLWTVYFSLRYSNGEGSIWPAIASGTLAIGFHAVTLPFLASVVFLFLVHTLAWRQLLSLKYLVPLVGLSSLVAAAALVVFSGPGVVVAPWPTDYSPYWAFSIEHLTDMLNLLLLMAPLVIPLALTRMAIKGRHRDTSTIVPLRLIAILAIVGVFWVDPEIGAARDFDLLALYGIPLSVMALASLLSRAVHDVSPTYWLVAVCAIAALQLAPNVFEKRDAPLAAANLDSILWNDAHYSKEYNQAQVAASWGFLLTRFDVDPDRPLKYFLRRLEAKPSSDIAAAHLGDAYTERGDTEAAARYYRIAAESAPGKAMNWAKLANALTELNLLREAIHAGSVAVEADPELVTAQTTLGIALFRSGDAKNAQPYFASAHQMQPDSAYTSANLGLCYYGLHVYDSALYYLTTAQSREAVTQGYSIERAIFYSHLQLDQYQEAAAVIERLQRTGAPTTMTNKLIKVLQHAQP